MFGDGPIPPERDRRIGDDDKSFHEVLLLFLRSWPYIRPQFLGRWLIPGEGVEQRVAETGSGYQLTYAPFLVAAIALVGPLLGVVPATMAWPMNLLYLPIAALVLSVFALAFSTHRRRMIATAGLVLSGLGTNISATFFIDGYADSFYAAGVTVAAIVGWMCQFRVDQGRLKVRVRVGAHLVYFYAINFAQRFIALTLGVILADLNAGGIKRWKKAWTTSLPCRAWVATRRRKTVSGATPRSLSSATGAIDWSGSSSANSGTSPTLSCTRPCSW